MPRPEFRSRAAATLRRHSDFLRVVRPLVIVMAPCFYAFLYFAGQIPTGSISLFTAVAIYVGLIAFMYLLEGVWKALLHLFAD